MTNKGEMYWNVFSRHTQREDSHRLVETADAPAAGEDPPDSGQLEDSRLENVKRWLTENADNIQLSYLPSYSAKLNPDELLNTYLKQRVTTAVLVRSRCGLTRTTVGAVRGIQKQPQRVQNYFHHKGFS